MSYYPIVLDWKGVPCLVAGGGAVALHKAEVLCRHGADVTVVAPEICEGLRSLPVRLTERPVTEEDVEGKRFVVDATGSGEAWKLLSEACGARGIPFNSACRVGDGSAVFPAVRQKGRTMVAVSTLGASPAACAWLADEVAARVPEGIDAILDTMADLRPLSRQWFSAQSDRRRFLHRCLDAMLKEGRPLTEEETGTIRREIEDTISTEENES